MILYVLQGTEVQVGGYDLVWCGGPVKGPKGAPNAGHRCVSVLFYAVSVVFCRFF